MITSSKLMDPCAPCEPSNPKVENTASTLRARSPCDRKMYTMSTWHASTFPVPWTSKTLNCCSAERRVTMSKVSLKLVMVKHMSDPSCCHRSMMGITSRSRFEDLKCSAMSDV